MPFVKQIDDWHHVQCGAAAVSRVHAVIDRNETDMIHREYVVDVAAHFDVITTEAGSFTRLPHSRHDNCADEYYNNRCAVAELQFLTRVRKIREPQTQNEKCPERAYSQFASMV